MDTVFFSIKVTNKYLIVFKRNYNHPGQGVPVPCQQGVRGRRRRRIDGGARGHRGLAFKPMPFKNAIFSMCTC